MAYFWPYWLSKQFRMASDGHIPRERLNTLGAAEKHYKYIAIFHGLFWVVLVFAGIAFELPSKPAIFGMVFRLGMLEVFLFFILVIRLIYTFEKQFIDCGHEPKLWRTIVLTVLWFSSICTMQKLTNLAIDQRAQV